MLIILNEVKLKKQGWRDGSTGKVLGTSKTTLAPMAEGRNFPNSTTN